MTDDPLGWPPSFDDEAYRLVGKTIASWSNIHEHIHNQIGMTRTLIYVLQARAWRAANPGRLHIDHVHNPRDIPDSRFKLRWRYFRRLISAINYGDKDVKQELDSLGHEIERLYAIRNLLAHSAILVSMRWSPASISLSSRSWSDDWERAEALSNRDCRPPNLSVQMTQAELNEIISCMESALQRLHRLPRPFDDTIAPPVHPKPPR